MSRARRFARFGAFGAAPVLAAAAIAIVTAAVASPETHQAAPHPSPPTTATSPPGPDSGAGPGAGRVPASIQLVSERSCGGLLRDLRAHTAAHVTAWGIGSPDPNYDLPRSTPAPLPVSAEGTTTGSSSVDHSGTNNQEPGVDEPDLVQTDGRRIVSVSGGVLRIVDVARRRIIATLDLSAYGGSESAQVLLHGDRVLVLLGDQRLGYANAPPSYGPVPYEPMRAASTGTTAILVDITGAPRTLATWHTAGSLIVSRMIGGTVRLVVASTPRFAFPTLPDNAGDGQRRAANRAVVGRAPLTAWLPSYSVTSGATTTTRTVPCSSVRNPKSWTGTSLVTVYTVGLDAAAPDLAPLTITADGVTAYASATSLYLAGSSGAATATQLHRFDIGGTGPPHYLGSGTVPGALFDPYSMSQYAGSLRVVTVTGRYTNGAATSVYVLDADTLQIVGHVSGLGRGENLHAVRFVGPLAYVVTFRSVDPLYVLDLRNPKAPRKAGTLTANGYSDYLHPVGVGRLLGIGQDVDADQRVTGLQLSLFDVTDVARPRRIARIVRAHTPSETPIDPHAFLWWPQTSTAIVPVDSWTAGESGAALVVRVTRRGLDLVGTIRNPAAVSTTGSDPAGGIERSLVIGVDVWTLSAAGLAVSDLRSLHRRAWIAF